MSRVEQTGDDVTWTSRCPCGCGEAVWRARRTVVIERGYSYQTVMYDIDCSREPRKAA